MAESKKDRKDDEDSDDEHISLIKKRARIEELVLCEKVIRRWYEVD